MVMTERLGITSLAVIEWVDGLGRAVEDAATSGEVCVEVCGPHTQNSGGHYHKQQGQWDDIRDH